MFYIPDKKQVVVNLETVKEENLGYDQILASYKFSQKYPGWKSNYFKHPIILEVAKQLGLKAVVSYADSGIYAKTVRAIDVSQPTEAHQAWESRYFLVGDNFYSTEEAQDLIFSAMSTSDIERVIAEMPEMEMQIAVNAELEHFRKRYRDAFLGDKFDIEKDEDDDSKLWRAVKQTLESCICLHYPAELGGNKQIDTDLVVDSLRKNESKAFQVFQDLIVAATGKSFEEILEEGRSLYKLDPSKAVIYAQKAAKTVCDYVRDNGLAK